MTYQPLPRFLTIKQSPTHGLGLFATGDIPGEEYLGVSHYLRGDLLVRTPLGGFYNHSDEPNCIKEEMKGDHFDKVFFLKTLRPIKAGEEITVKYTLYEISV